MNNRQRYNKAKPTPTAPRTIPRNAPAAPVAAAAAETPEELLPDPEVMAAVLLVTVPGPAVLAVKVGLTNVALTIGPPGLPVAVTRPLP